jgi:hypothetical protein
MNYNSKYPAVAIFSGERSNRTPDANAIITERVQACLECGLSEEGLFAPVDGCYKGKTEKSFKVNVENKSDWETVKRIATVCEQESVLLIDNERNAFLFFLQSSKAEFIGVLTAVPKAEALKHEAYTYDPTLDTYFICQ